MALKTREHKNGSRDLNPASEDYHRRFDEITSSPDMRALDDQMNATRRDDGSVAERRSIGGWLDDKLDDAQDSSWSTRDAARSAEKDELDNVENSMGYRGGEPDKRPFNKQRNRVAAWVAGGGATVMLSFFGLGSIMPFKIQGVMGMISEEVGQRVEQIVLHRAKVIVARAIMERLGVKSGPVITGKGPLSSLIATLRTMKFENVLKSKGLEFFEENGKVSLKVAKGESWETVAKGLKSPDDILRILDSDAISSRSINAIVKENIPVWRMFKRAKFAKWLRIKYNIPRFGREKKATDDTDPKTKDVDPETKAIKNEIKSEVEDAAQRKQQMFDDVMKILDGDNKNASNQSNEVASREASSTVKKTIAEKSAEVGRALEGATTKEAAMVLGKAGLKLGAKAASKAVPIYGWVMLWATFMTAFDIFQEKINDGTFFTMLSDVRGAQMAIMYAKYAGLDSQYKLGTQDRNLMNYDASKFDGVEQSAMFNCISKNYAAGCDQVGEQSTKINETISSLDDFQSMVSKMTGMSTTDVRSMMTLIDISTFTSRKAGRVLYWIDNTIVGGLTSLAGDAALSVIKNQVPFGAQAVEALTNITNSMTDQLLDYAYKTLGINVNTLATGAELFGNMLGGGVFGMTKFCREHLKCHDLSLAESISQNQKFAADKADYIRSKGPFFALFSPEVTSSVTSQLALRTSSSSRALSGQVLQTAASVLGAIPGIFSSQFSRSSSANSPTTVSGLVGMKEAGFTQAELNGDIDNSMLSTDAYDCTKSTNAMCSVDQEVISSMICLDSANVESPDCNPDAADAGPDSGSPMTGLPSGNSQELAKQIVPLLGNKVVCVGNTDGCHDIRNNAEGKSSKQTGSSSSGSVGCAVDSIDPRILGVILGLVQKGHTMTITSLCWGRTAHSNGDNHVMGRGVDIGIVDGQVIGGGSWAKADQMLLDVTTLLPPQKQWFGQNGCSRTSVFQEVKSKGYVVGPDACNHQHISVY